MHILIYFIIFLVSVYFWYNQTYGNRNKLLSKFPSPKTYPILNHLPHILGKSPAEIFKIRCDFIQALGPVWRFDLSPFTSFITVSDPTIAEEILTSHKLIKKGPEYKMLHDWCGDGLIFSSGTKWHQRRKILTQAFHFKILDQYIKIMESNLQYLIQKLYSTRMEKVEFFSIISIYTLDVICEAAMGYELRALENEASDYVKAVKEMTSIFIQKAFDPKKQIKFLYQFTKLCKREKYLITKLHEFTDSVIVARRKYLNENELEHNTTEKNDLGIKSNTVFLDLLLKLRIDGTPLDNASIREEVDTFMFAGHDTTSSALASLFLNLAKYPDIQQLVYEECEEIFADNRNRVSTLQDFSRMKYLEKVIKESLRLHPGVPFYSRIFDEDVKLGNYVFPANVAVKISPYGMGRDPNLFPNPLQFDPSRFDDEKNIRFFSFLPFSAGPRNCLGQKFAMFELKSVASKIIRNFHITVDKDDENPVYITEVVLRPINGIYLRFYPRNNA